MMRVQLAEKMFSKGAMDNLYQLNPREFEEGVCTMLEEWQEAEAKRYYKLTGQYPRD